MSGRFHFYEGYDYQDLVAPVRVMKLMGVKRLILTNAAGAVNESYRPGDVMIIKDHIKMTGASPMCGPNADDFGPRFFDVGNMYSREIVSLEDIVEEITGDIEDEHDNTKYVAKQLAEGEYMISARLEIEKVNELFDLDLPESDDYMTVGGLILHEYQSFPKLNEVVKIGHFEFKIIKNTMTKIELVRLKVIQ